MKLAGIILAAGESRRMGFPKALLKYEGQSFLERLIDVLGRSCDPVITVLGPESVRIRGGTRNSIRSGFVVNSNYGLGQFSSLQCGLRTVPSFADTVLFTLVDHPRIAPETIELLIAEPPKPISIARYNGKRGHPVLFDAALIPEFLAFPPTASAKEIITKYESSIRYVDADDPGIVDDIDDPAKYKRLTGFDLEAQSEAAR